MSSAAIIGIAAAVTTLILGATLVVLVNPQLLASWFGAADLSNLSNFGQFVSGVFAPVAFVWLAVAVLLQSRELELQRMELRDTREVFELQKEEMKRAADENREQTQIMKDNLRSEGERQIYNEVDIVLYSLATYMAANWDKSVANGTHIINLQGYALSLNKDNSDRAYQLARNSLDRYFANFPGRASAINDDCGRFLDHCRDQIASLCEDQRYTSNRLVLARIESLGLKPLLGLIRSIKTS